MYQPIDNIGVETNIVMPNQMKMFSLVESQYHHPTKPSVIIKNILDASLGVCQPLWSIRGANSQSDPAHDHKKPAWTN